MWRLGVELGLQTHHVERLVNRCFWPSEATAEKLVDGLREKILRLEAAGPRWAADSVLAWLSDPGASRRIKDPASLREVLGEPADERDDWVADILQGLGGEFVDLPQGRDNVLHRGAEHNSGYHDALTRCYAEPGVHPRPRRSVRDARPGRITALTESGTPGHPELRDDLDKLTDVVKRLEARLAAVERSLAEGFPRLKKEADSVTRKIERLNKESQQLEERIRTARNLREDLGRLNDSCAEVVARLEKHSGRHSDGGAGG
jgi:hypothetical protein